MAVQKKTRDEYEGMFVKLSLANNEFESLALSDGSRLIYYYTIGDARKALSEFTEVITAYDAARREQVTNEPSGQTERS